MKRVVISGLALAATALVAPAGATSVDNIPTVAGPLCAFEPLPHRPGDPADVHTALVRGGPISVSVPGRTVTGIYLICSLQAGHATHNGPDVARTALWGVGTVEQPRTRVTYRSAAGVPMYSCTELWIDTILGHDSFSYDAVSGQFVRSVEPHCGAGFGTQIAGAITTANGGLAGKCAYVGVTTINGRIQFVFGGSVESYSGNPVSQPQATQAVCELISPNQSGVPGSEPTYTQSTSIALAGAVAPTPPAYTSSHPVRSWPLRPVLICVSGFGVYGPQFPAHGNPRYLDEACSSNAL